jgi:hypothetical protein
MINILKKFLRKITTTYQTNWNVIMSVIPKFKYMYDCLHINLQYLHKPILPNGLDLFQIVFSIT